MSSDRLLDLLERAATLVRNEERTAVLVHGLQPVHLQVLRYLAQCNRYSDTPAAVTEYLGLTKGTVSQTLLLLGKKGLVERQASSTDGRVVHLHLTEAGRKIVNRAMSSGAFRRSLESLPDDGRRLELELEHLLRITQQSSGNRSFGVCNSCVHFQKEKGGFRCGLTGEPLSREDGTRICREHSEGES